MRDFNEKERKLIAELERCLSKCDKAGLYFCGMDTELIVCHSPAFDKAGRECHGYNLVAQASLNGYPGSKVINAPSYLDSGGW